MVLQIIQFMENNQNIHTANVHVGIDVELVIVRHKTLRLAACFYLGNHCRGILCIHDMCDTGLTVREKCILLRVNKIMR